MGLVDYSNRADGLRKLIEAFEEKMMLEHGFTFPEARWVTQHELHREDDRRIRGVVARRSRGR